MEKVMNVTIPAKVASDPFIKWLSLDFSETAGVGTGVGTGTLTVGATDGDMDKDGAIDKDGSDDGDSDTDGSDDGDTVGKSDGWDDGDTVGETDGWDDGLSVGGGTAFSSNLEWCQLFVDLARTAVTSSSRSVAVFTFNVIDETRLLMLLEVCVTPAT